MCSVASNFCDVAMDEYEDEEKSNKKTKNWNEKKEEE